MKIVIVDDTKEMSILLDQYLEDYFEDRIVLDPSEIKERFYYDYDIYFLDIEMNPSGIEIAKKLNDVHPQAICIFMTNHESYIFETQILNPFYFIRKSKWQADLKIALSLLEDKIHHYLNISYNFENIKVDIKNIKYIEIYRGKITIHTIEKDIEYWDTLSRLEKILPPKQFIKIHRSYIINKNYITALSKQQVTIDNIHLPLSRGNSKKVYQLLSNDY